MPTCFVDVDRRTAARQRQDAGSPLYYGVIARALGAAASGWEPPTAEAWPNNQLRQRRRGSHSGRMTLGEDG